MKRAVRLVPLESAFLVLRLLSFLFSCLFCFRRNGVRSSGALTSELGAVATQRRLTSRGGGRRVAKGKESRGGGGRRAAGEEGGQQQPGAAVLSPAVSWDRALRSSSRSSHPGLGSLLPSAAATLHFQKLQNAPHACFKLQIIHFATPFPWIRRQNQRQVSLGDTHRALPAALACCNTARSNQGRNQFFLQQGVEKQNNFIVP